MRRLLVILGMAGLLGTAQAQSWRYESGTTFSLNGCTRLAQGASVECSFRVVNSQQDRPLFFSRWGISISAQGSAALPASRLYFEGQPLAFDQVARLKKGQVYSLRVQYSGFAGDYIRAITIDEAGTRYNIPLRTAVGNTGNTMASPGTISPEWKWVGFSNGRYRVMIHSCYKVGATANCYASLVASNVTKKPFGKDGNVSMQSAYLISFAQQPINAGQVKLKIGDTTFTVPVR